MGGPSGNSAMDANKSCMVITLDVKNAFNSAKWCKIIEALGNLGTPKYLTEKLLCYDSDDGPKIHRTSCEVLGLLLCIITNDEILRLQLPEEVTVIGFGDDIGCIFISYLS